MTMIPISEAAKITGQHPNNVRKVCKNGLISSTKEKFILVPLDEVQAYASLTQGQKIRLRKHGYTIRDLLNGQVTQAQINPPQNGDGTYEKKSDRMPPEYRLLAAIFNQAKRDLHNRDPLIRQDALTFFRSDNTWDLLGQAGIPIPEEHRRQYLETHNR